MKQHKATVMVDGKVVLEDLVVGLENYVTQGGMQGWRGKFTLPDHSRLPPIDTHHIVLDDGREGDFLVEEQTISSHSPTRVIFQGTGPLAAPQG